MAQPPDEISANFIFGTSVAEINADDKISVKKETFGLQLSVICIDQTSQGKLRLLFQQISEKADILLLCSDLVDYG